MRKERRELGGIMDWFRRKAAQERGLSVPSGRPLPTPSIFDAFKPQLPAERKQEPQLPAPVPAPTKKRGGLLSIFDIFTPTPVPESRLPAAPQEPVTMEPIPWQELFTPPAMFEEPIQEMIIPPPPIERMLPTEIFTRAGSPPAPKGEPQYTFIRLPRLQVGQWVTPTPGELGAHFQGIFNTEKIFEDIRAMRETGEWAQAITDHAGHGMPLSVKLEPVAYQNFFTDFAKLYNIPWNVMESYLANAHTDQEVASAQEAVLRDIVGPMNQRVGEAFELIKPKDLPGWFWVGYDGETNSWWLHYIEAMLGPLRLTGRD